MSYRTVFEIDKSGFKYWWFPLLPLLAGCLAFLAYEFRGFFPESNIGFHSLPQQWQDNFYIFLSVAFILTGIFTFASMLSDFIGLRRAYANSDCEIAEGMIEDFDCYKRGNGFLEQFTVDGEYFRYSDSIVSAGFNTPSAKGGPLREGMQVRIHHINGTILRLDVNN